MSNWRVLVGDVREKLAELPDKSVQCCVTSPPYWALRDYGVAGQIGMEATPDEFVAVLVSVFRDVKRVLRDDGTLWMNLGDSYLAQQGSGFNGQKRLDHANRNVKVQRPAGMKPKDLAGIPWTVALALRADGWYLRSDIIWAKPNPMPESVTDRPTKAHEYVFLLSKSERYYYDSNAIKNPPAESTLREMRDGYQGQATKAYEGTGAQNPSDVKARIIARLRDKQRGHGRRHAGLNDRWDGMSEEDQVALGSNARTVWTIATQPYPEAHFATFPEALPERCIKAGSSDEGACPACGAPWRRVTETASAYTPVESTTAKGAERGNGNGYYRPNSRETGGIGGSRHAITRDWQPSCACDAGEPVPCVVLDPFCGSGTTGQVAIQLGRDFVGIELNPTYAELSRRRIGGAAPLFSNEATA